MIKAKSHSPLNCIIDHNQISMLGDFMNFIVKQYVIITQESFPFLILTVEYVKTMGIQVALQRTKI